MSPTNPPHGLHVGQSQRTVRRGRGRGVETQGWKGGCGGTEGNSRWCCVQWALGTPRACCPPMSHHVLLHPGSSGAAGRPSHSGVKRSTALMYPELMFNESCIFRQVRAGGKKTLKMALLCCFEGGCVCVCACAGLYIFLHVSVRTVFTRVCCVPDKCIY